MENDDAPVGRFLTRREIVALLGASGVAAVTGRGTALHAIMLGGRRLPPCIVRPQQTAGPYFVDEKLNRSDIRANPADGALKAGVPLALAFNVSRVSSGGCTALPNAQVDVWHCDAEGVYSDAVDRSFNTVGQKFLRGYQVTDATGVARFATIYPGWYPGRTVHVHFRIRTDPAAARSYQFTSQLYFDDTLSDKVFTQAPYAGKGQRNTRNRDDRIFAQGGDQLMISPTSIKDGYVATFDIGLDIA